MTSSIRTDVRLVDGILTHARVVGHGPPLVLVPGLACAAYVYDRLALALAPHFEVWAYDPPGHGRSHGRPDDHHTIARLTDHLQDWLRAARLEGAAMVGHSLGGEVALALAARPDPMVSALVLLAPTGVPDNPVVALQCLRLLADAFAERPSFLARILPAYVRVGLRGMYVIAADQASHSTVPLLPRVRVPVLVVEGRHDPVISHDAVRTLCAHLPWARARTVDGAHAFWYARPDEVASLVTDFLNGPRPDVP